MQIIENLQVKEKLYTEKLENGLNIMIIPKKGIKKKYVMWATHYGSMDNKFVVPGEDKETEVITVEHEEEVRLRWLKLKKRR